jgi:type 1 glutamine amidotransferase
MPNAAEKLCGVRRNRAAVLLLWIAFVASPASLAVPTPAANETATGSSRPHVVMLIAEPEYETARTLPEFAATELQSYFDVTFVGAVDDPSSMAFQGLEAIESADVLLVSVRRRAPPKEQLDMIRRFVASGRPVVGIRTASHAFALRRGTPPAGLADWPDWDGEVFGGHYAGHFPDGATATITGVNPTHAVRHRIEFPFVSAAKLYRVAPLRANATAILLGTIPGEAPEPIAYIATHSGGGRAFYTSLGDPRDFGNPSFRRLLVNALLWAVGDDNAPAQDPR